MWQVLKFLALLPAALIGLLIILFGIGVAFGSKTASGPTTYTAQEVAQSSGLAIAVDKVTRDWQSPNQFDTPSSPQDIFVVVSITMRNTGTADAPLSGFWDFELEDAHGIKHREALSGIGLNKLSTSGATSIGPNGTLSGDLIFAVPRSAAEKLVLHHKPLLSLQDPVAIELR
jgi:Domain of unknown function (DUF4352)